ncbi:MAG: HK97 family phage prohead protease [Alphaproteobacteria bacterium]|nr:HK97 family phage prohead protease [Alphaproteobacteria bacterium]
MDMKHMERPLALKALAADGQFSGYASVFGKLDHQSEIVAAGAFSRTLGKWRGECRSPAMLWMHDPTQPIGVWMSLYEDKNGLAVQGKLALRTQKGMEAYELLKMGALTGMSIGYRVVSSKVDIKRKARILTDIDLFEISLVTFPANESARVSDVKSPAAHEELSSRLKDDSDATRAIVARLNQAAQNLQNTKHYPTRRV